MNSWIKRIIFNPRLRMLLGRYLPVPVKEFLKNTYKYLQISGAKLSRKRDFYQRLSIYPTLLKSEKNAVLNRKLLPIQGPRPDVICFSIIDWNFRFQRPQQIMTQFAKNGHRVFYINISSFLSASGFSRFTVRPIQKNIQEVTLSVHQVPNIYGECLSEENRKALFDSLDELRRTYKIDEAISYVMIASWTSLALDTRAEWGWHVVYDCMDEWENFPLITSEILEAEIELVQKCDVLVVTSQQLYDKWSAYKAPIVLARNATDYEFYSEHCRPNRILKGIQHPIIGYYGAIAAWFDVELMTHIARNRPQYHFVLLGGVFDVDISELQSLSNVTLLGQQPYESMPQYLYHFDVCIIPFKVNAITEATDPVKAYEYLSGGKPIVSVALPELKPYQALLSLASDSNDFLTRLDQAVTENDPALVERRKAFARQNSWEKRYEQIMNGIRESTPKASIVIVSYNNLHLNRLCVESILRNVAYPNFEIIIVDNNSSDDTQAYLKAMSGMYENIKAICNTGNNGFAKANNQGLALSTGEYLILLNNDTIVPAGWLSRLIRHIDDPEIGIIGSVTNSVYNEARVETNYILWEEMEDFARDYTWRNDRYIADIYMLAMYCVAFRRDVYEAIGPLDERFGTGMFEDDDYSLRIRQRGLKVMCALDVFVHHFGQASFKALHENGTYDSLFEENRRKYEQKWNVEWVQHRNVPLQPYLHQFGYRRSVDNKMDVQ